jgi:hypothetical protein
VDGGGGGQFGLVFDNKQMSANLVGDKIYIKWFKNLVIFDSVNNTFGEVQQDNLTYACTMWNGNFYGLGLDYHINVYDVDTRTWEPTESVWEPDMDEDETEPEAIKFMLTTWCPEEPRDLPWFEAMIVAETKRHPGYMNYAVVTERHSSYR